MIGIQSFEPTPTTLSASGTHFVMPFASAIEDDNDVASTERPVVAGTVDRLGVYITSNGITGNSTVTMEIDDVDSSLVLTITGATTGFFEDTSNAPTVANDEDITYRWDGGAGGTTLGYNRIRTRFEADTDETSLIGCNASGSSNHSTDSNTSFFPFEGQRGILTTESFTQYEHLVAGTLADLYVRVGNCTRTGDTVTGRSRIGAVNGNQSVSMTGNTSNTDYQDTSNTDSISVNNLVNYSSTTGANPGNFNYEKVCASYTTTTGQYVQAIRSAENSQRVNDNVTAWWPPGGNQGVEETSTESDVQVDVPEDTTVSNLSIKIDRMTGTVSTTTTFRDDSVSGSMSVALAAVGYAEDTSNEDDIVAGSEVNVQVTSPVGGTNYDVNYVGWVGAAVVATVGPTLKHPMSYHFHNLTR